MGHWTYLNLDARLLAARSAGMVTQRTLGGRQSDKRREGGGETGEDDQVASSIECIFLLVKEDERKGRTEQAESGSAA